MNFMENNVLVSFEEYATQSNDYSESVAKIKQDIEKLNDFVGELKASVSQISENVEDVKNISAENKIAVVEIVQKSESTAEIAVEIQKQSEENKTMADELGSIVNKFTLE